MPAPKAQPVAEAASSPAEVLDGLGLDSEDLEGELPLLRVHDSKLPRKKKQANDDQDEFTFNEEDAQRGYFEKTDRNDYKDEDLDVPTYLRRGIKIKLKV